MEASTADVPDTLAVIGAGTMGSGIAQLAAQTGARTLLYDAVPEELTKGMDRIESGLRRLVERGRMSAKDVNGILGRLEPADALSDLAPAGLVIEAAPESLELKIEMFSELAGIVSEDCVLATNTSSLSVTEIAAGTPGAERVVGMHFFNPAPVMKLVEVVAGAASSKQALAVARAVGTAMGRTVIDAGDVAGFLVNRCNRPFGLVSLRLLQERVADVVTIDRIVRMEGGFRLGPFELQDLIGLDTNFAVAEAFQRQSYGEARYQPSPLQARMLAAGRLGRKTGRGWYEYEGETLGRNYRPADPELTEAVGGEGRSVLVLGDLPVMGELADAARAAGFRVATDGGEGEAPWLTVIGDGSTGCSAVRARLLWDASLHGSDPEAAGFHIVPPLESHTLIEITSTAKTDPESLERLQTFVAALGRHAEQVGDAPGLVLGRIITGLINEAGFLIGEGNATAEDVDAGMTLGLNHPRGPVAWSHALGLEHVVGLLDALHRELGEERYRVAPLLRRLVALGEPGLADG